MIDKIVQLKAKYALLSMSSALLLILYILANNFKNQNFLNQKDKLEKEYISAINAQARYSSYLEKNGNFFLQIFLSEIIDSDDSILRNHDYYQVFESVWDNQLLDPTNGKWLSINRFKQSGYNPGQAYYNLEWFSYKTSYYYYKLFPNYVTLNDTMVQLSKQAFNDSIIEKFVLNSYVPLIDKTLQRKNDKALVSFIVLSRFNSYLETLMGGEVSNSLLNSSQKANLNDEPIKYIYEKFYLNRNDTIFCKNLLDNWRLQALTSLQNIGTGDQNTSIFGFQIENQYIYIVLSSMSFFFYIMFFIFFSKESFENGSKSEANFLLSPVKTKFNSSTALIIIKLINNIVCVIPVILLFLIVSIRFQFVPRTSSYYSTIVEALIKGRSTDFSSILLDWLDLIFFFISLEILLVINKLNHKLNSGFKTIIIISTIIIILLIVFKILFVKSDSILQIHLSEISTLLLFYSIILFISWKIILSYLSKNWYTLAISIIIFGINWYCIYILTL